MRTSFLRLVLLGLVASISLLATERAVIDRLIELASSQPNSAAFRSELLSVMGEEKLQTATAIVGNGPDFIWALESEAQPRLYVDDRPMAGKMRRIKSTSTWFFVGTLKTGTAHEFHYLVDGRVVGGANDIPAYTPDSYQKPDVPQGKMTDKQVHVSKIFDGMETDYWVYVPAQYDPSIPAALMVWQDGVRFSGRNTEDGCNLCPSLYRVQEVTDNLIHDGKIPVIIHLFISPGTIGDKAMRSIEYDSVSDRYPRFLLDEILPELYAKYNIRRDAYSRAIQGQSSGGICAFNAGWHHPEEFSRIATHIGTFVPLALRNGEPEGGHLYPHWVRRDEKKNLRVWISDNSNDHENAIGSWPLQNIQMANSLKLRDYDFRFEFGGGTHHAALWASMLPEALTWLWRDYDPTKTEQIYEQDPAEKEKPVFRVTLSNR
jgi:enterochelin esterase-like enzyme